MLRTTLTIGGSIANNSLSVLSVLPNTVCVQCLRWHRKPRWVPVAKSKMFRIPVKPIIPADEKAEITRLYQNYKCHMRSLRRHIREVTSLNSVGEDVASVKAAELEDYQQRMKLNAEWNESVAKSREIRLENERKIRKEQILEKILQKEERERQNMEKINEIIRNLKAQSASFITEKNIDQAIEEAVNNPIDHNWAIDENGTVYRGKYVRPEGEDIGKNRRAMRNA